MSFSIGPFVGKRDAVIKAVANVKGYGDESQLNAVKDFIKAEVEKLPESATIQAKASGHHDPNYRNVTIEIGYPTATLVE